MKFYQCEKCKSIYTLVKDPVESLNCCGDPLQELVPNSTQASLEKHIPVVEQFGRQVHVRVGAETHPMLPEHYIEWILIETTNGYQLKNLVPNTAPAATFILADEEEVLAAYAYCNIHKLWKN